MHNPLIVISGIRENNMLSQRSRRTNIFRAFAEYFIPTSINKIAINFGSFNLSFKVVVISGVIAGLPNTNSIE
jgi:hypothetical protein